MTAKKKPAYVLLNARSVITLPMNAERSSVACCLHRGARTAIRCGLTKNPAHDLPGCNSRCEHDFLIGLAGVSVLYDTVVGKRNLFYPEHLVYRGENHA